MATRIYKNKSGGGAATNRNGLKFERETSLKDAFSKQTRYEVHKGDKIFDTHTNKEVGQLYDTWGAFYRNLITANGINYQDILSRQLQPDDAILVGSTLYIIEKKYQESKGSADEKLQTCAFKKSQYTRLVEDLNLTVEYYYLLSDWFYNDIYRDVKNYILEAGCKFFYKEIPLSELGL
jgi:hypothetical protein